MTNIIPLSELRDKIDKIDSEILQLINQRASCAMEVAKTKIAEGGKGTFYRPDREALVLRRIKELNPGPLSDDTSARFFRELMSSCLALEEPLEVAFLGPEGTFTQQATFKHFGQAVQSIPVSTIDEIFTEVENQHCQFGVVPVENSTEGVITHTLDRFITSPLKICGEVEIRVRHNLMGHVEKLEDITEVFSHQQSLAQCRQWLDTHLPNAVRTAVSSNAEAARLAADSQNKMAIAGEVAASLYQLNILKSNIEDASDNTTRFIIIGQQEPPSTGMDKTSLLVSTGNHAGSLHQILGSFAQHGICLSHIESRPSKQGLWDYVFFIDFKGHKEDSEVCAALELLKQNVNLLNILGSYPKAVI
ncbi:MAG: prephenate dehydratase [Methylococcales symbiont of Hymedesmia sp. n. MRB-2018]|nr:MAG: prephenate dehydratase [Methylococcales symbiont of Hymedesmia sp. n. MRB-2018]